MRVLLLHDYGTLSGGAEVMIVALRDALRSRGHEAILFTSTARPLPLPLVSDQQCFGTVSPLRRVLQAANPHAMARLRTVLRDFRPDVVHVKMFLTQLSPLVLPLLRPFPSLLHVVNYNLVCPINTKTLPDGTPCRQRAGFACHAAGCMSWPGVARAFVQRRMTALDGFDRVVANSEWVARRLQAEGIRVDEAIPNGVPVRPQRPPLGTTPVVGFAGRLVPKKGVDVLLRAVALLRERMPEVRLIVAGDGPERIGLERLAAELGIRDAVDFLGHLAQAQAEHALGTAWVQAVPSRWEEPFGIVAAEAMMRGTAVVASESGGLAEQVVLGVTGYLAPAGDARALAGALGQVVRDRDLAERMGASARVRALAELTIDRHVDRVVAAHLACRRGGSR
jgi:glycosyltransferase involved in cell wall biosynthesis